MKFIAALLIVAGFSVSQPVQAQSNNRGAYVPIEQFLTYNENTKIAYIAGAVDGMLHRSQRYCAPESLNLGEILKLVEAELIKHTALRTVSASMVIQYTLMTSFPCEDKK